jgi:hypothetical protein
MNRVSKTTKAHSELDARQCLLTYIGSMAVTPKAT